MTMEITFPGGLAVEARYKGFTIRTDRPVAEGGGGSAPTPFDFFLVSLGTCAGHYALAFCRERDIATEGLAVRLSTRADNPRRLAEIDIDIDLPPGFPERHREGLTRVVRHCSVKRHLGAPPEFAVTLHRAAADAGTAGGR